MGKIADDIINSIINRANNALKDAYKEALPKIEKNVKKQWKSAINEFYNSYNPIYYSRSYSLYNLLSTRITSDNIYISTDSNNLNGSYRVDDDYIYDIIYKEGWHGGATDGIDSFGKYHPKPGIPYWRTPTPIYSHWGNQSIKTVSPFDLFNKKLESIREESIKTIIDSFYKYY